MIDLDIALYKLDPTYYFNHSGSYESLVMLDGRDKPSLASLESMWQDWLNTDKRQEALAKVEEMAEAERLKYITNGAGKAMAYQQQQREVERWENGVTNPERFPVATEYAAKLGVSIEAVLLVWQTNINNWLVIGAKIEGNLAKYKAQLSNLVISDESDLTNFMNGINFYA